MMTGARVRSSAVPLDQSIPLAARLPGAARIQATRPRQAARRAVAQPGQVAKAVADHLGGSAARSSVAEVAGKRTNAGVGKGIRALVERCLRPPGDPARGDAGKAANGGTLLAGGLRKRRRTSGRCARAHSDHLLVSWERAPATNSAHRATGAAKNPPCAAIG